MALAGVVVISPDTLLLRLLTLDHWTIVFGRGVLTSIGLLVILGGAARKQGTKLLPKLVNTGIPGIWIAILSAGSNILFVISIRETHVANTLAIVAISPLIAAILSRVFLKERISVETWVASTFAIGAVGLMVSNSIGTDRLFGDVAALGATLMLAVNLTISRRNRHHSIVPAFVGAGLISAAATVWLANPASIIGRDAMYLAINGLVVIPIALSLLWVAPRYISAPQTALFYLLELVLGPFWVWMVLGDAPPGHTIAAGLLLLLVLAMHTSVQNVRGRAAGPPLCRC